MKKGILLVPALLFATTSLNANAGDQSCPANIQTALAHSFGLHKPASEGSDSVFSSAACKLAPNDNHVLIAAVAWPKPHQDDDTETLLVATLDAVSGKILSQYRTDILEDAVTAFGPNSLSIDTARYQLADDVRAFGVRFDSAAEQPRCAEGTFGQALTLFAPSGKALAPVLGVYMYNTQGMGSCEGPDGNSDWEEASLTVGLEKTASHGYADLRISAAIKPVDDGEAKDPKLKKHTESYVLHYDGKTYPVPDEKKWWLVKYSTDN